MKKSKNALAVVALAVIVVCLVGLAMVWNKTRPISPVEAYLAENLGVGQFEIVKTFRPVNARGARIFRVPDSRLLTESAWMSHARLGDYHWKKIDRPGTAIRVKYRTKTVLGTSGVQDHVFLIEDGEVDELVESIDFRYPGESKEKWAKRMKMRSKW